MCLVSTASESMNSAKFSISAELALPMEAGLNLNDASGQIVHRQAQMRPRGGSLLVRAHNNARR
jgi:hypothetical protein